MDITENLWRVTGKFLSKLCFKGHKSFVLLCKAGYTSLTMKHSLGNTCSVAGPRLCSFLKSDCALRRLLAGGTRVICCVKYSDIPTL